MVFASLEPALLGVGGMRVRRLLARVEVIGCACLMILSLAVSILGWFA
jgi:hypothetical protein